MKLNKTRVMTSLLIVAAVGTVIVQNTQPVQSRFFVVDTTMPQAALMGLMLAAGFALGLALKNRIVSCWQATSDTRVSDASKSDASKSDASKSDASKSDASKSDASKSDASGTVTARAGSMAPENAEAARSPASLSA